MQCVYHVSEHFVYYLYLTQEAGPYSAPKWGPTNWNLIMEVTNRAVPRGLTIIDQVCHELAAGPACETGIRHRMELTDSRNACYNYPKKDGREVTLWQS